MESGRLSLASAHGSGRPGLAGNERPCTMTPAEAAAAEAETPGGGADAVLGCLHPPSSSASSHPPARSPTTPALPASARRPTQVCGSAGRCGSGDPPSAPRDPGPAPWLGFEAPPPTRLGAPCVIFASLPPTYTGRWSPGVARVWRDARSARRVCAQPRPAGVWNPFSSSPAPLPAQGLTRRFQAQWPYGDQDGCISFVADGLGVMTPRLSLVAAQRSLLAPTTTSISWDTT